jgi:hypothetical protein
MLPDPQDYTKALGESIESYAKYSRTWMRVWGIIYYVLRTLLIVASACVAAKATVPSLESFSAYLALFVAIGTSLDTWLKTGSRYRGHYMFNDKFISLQTDLELTHEENEAEFEKVKDNFIRTVAEYSAAVQPI